MNEKINLEGTKLGQPAKKDLHLQKRFFPMCHPCQPKRSLGGSVDHSFEKDQSAVSKPNFLGWWLSLNHPCARHDLGMLRINQSFGPDHPVLKSLVCDSANEKTLLWFNHFRSPRVWPSNIPIVFETALPMGKYTRHCLGDGPANNLFGSIYGGGCCKFIASINKLQQTQELRPHNSKDKTFHYIRKYLERLVFSLTCEQTKRFCSRGFVVAQSFVRTKNMPALFRTGTFPCQPNIYHENGKTLEIRMDS